MKIIKGPEPTGVAKRILNCFDLETEENEQGTKHYVMDDRATEQQLQERIDDIAEAHYSGVVVNALNAIQESGMTINRAFKDFEMYNKKIGKIFVVRPRNLPEEIDVEFAPYFFLTPNQLGSCDIESEINYGITIYK